MYETVLIGPHTTYFTTKGEKTILLIGDNHQEIFNPEYKEKAKLANLGNNIYSYIDFFKNFKTEDRSESNTLVLLETRADLYFNFPKSLHNINDDEWNKRIKKEPSIDVLEDFLHIHPGINVVPVDIRFYGEYEFLHNISFEDLYKLLFDDDTLYCLETIEECDMELLQTSMLKQQDYEILSKFKRVFENIDKTDIEKIKEFFIKKFIEGSIHDIHSFMIEIYTIGNILTLNEQDSTIVIMGALHIETILDFLIDNKYNIEDCQYKIDGEPQEQISVFNKYQTQKIKEI
tara:strand:+ start:2103 stop:2969 length:867 start_codon:yes stop_codon:yes gene_type:complete